MSCMTLHIHTHRSHGHGVAVMLEDEQCPCPMKHVSSGQPVIEHIESNPAVPLKSPQIVWPTGLVNYFDILLTVDVFYEKVQAQRTRKARGDSLDDFQRRKS